MTQVSSIDIKYGEVTRSVVFRYPDGTEYINPGNTITIRDEVSETSIVKSTTVTPGYRQLVQSGKRIPVQPFSYSKIEWKFGHARYRTAQYYADGAMEVKLYEGDGKAIAQFVSLGQIFPRTTPSSELIASAVRQSTNRLLLNIQDQSVNVAQMIAERKQTLSMIADNATRIANAIRAVRRGDIGSAVASLGGGSPSRRIRRNLRANRGTSARQVSQNWLQLQYGWLPLLSDVDGLAKQLASDRPTYADIRAEGSATLRDSYQLINIPADKYNFGQEVTIDQKVTVKQVAYFQIKAETTALAGQLGLTNPLALAWELVPYSFVVDWFLPIGNYLQSLDATAGCQFTDGSVTTVTETIVTWRWFGDGSADPGFGTRRDWHQSMNYTVKEKVLSIDRSKMSSFPSPMLPDVKNPLSWRHAANALALLRQAVK